MRESKADVFHDRRVPRTLVPRLDGRGYCDVAAPIKARMFLPMMVAFAAALFAAEVKPLPRAHAHNDYEHARPLLDALDRGFCGVEADIWLVDGKLLVAHSAKEVKPERTLERLYLDPLRERVRANGGRVYRGGPPIVLLIDIKSEAAPTYAALHAVLKNYTELLTTFRGDAVETKAIHVIISGNRPREDMLAQSVRYSAYDGRSTDLEAAPPAAFVPWISENWQKLSQWKWEGEMPAEDRTMLKAYVARAHEQGKKVRLWNTPDRPDAWRMLTDCGVDIIGTDDLAGLAKWLAK